MLLDFEINQLCCLDTSVSLVAKDLGAIEETYVITAFVIYCSYFDVFVYNCATIIILLLIVVM